jgi:hypothetical protein
MTSNIFISIFICLVFSSCNQAKNPPKPYQESRELVPNPEGYKKDSFITANEDTSLVYIVFGVYCGECMAHNCATMYKYTLIGNTHMLLADYNDSFFKDSGTVVCSTIIQNPKKMDIAYDIVSHIPAQLLLTTKSTDRFGCPDCTDGCGIYFELKRGQAVKKFYIDYQTSQLTGDIKIFAEYLIKAIEKIGK